MSDGDVPDPSAELSCEVATIIIVKRFSFHSGLFTTFGVGSTSERVVGKSDYFLMRIFRN